MSNGNVYVVDLDLAATLELIDVGTTFVKIEGAQGREDFYLNVDQVVAVYPAEQRD